MECASHWVFSSCDERDLSRVPGTQPGRE
jgi:hypothetical protein